MAAARVYFWLQQPVPMSFYPSSPAMPALTLLRYPDPRLKIHCLPIADFDDELRQFAEDLLQAMRAAPGVGITAAHVGVAKRLVIIELDRAQGVLIYANPEIIWTSAEVGRNTEGSVCMPGATEEVERPDRIRFRYQDLHGGLHEEEVGGFLSVCIQHEIDQLDGIFWLQRLSRLKRERLVKKWEKAIS
ncbi:MAG: peptide deformylase [Acidobacteriaceae bacterium]|nr:peptide deformylase [Acidobacteriaceae bacterium]